MNRVRRKNIDGIRNHSSTRTSFTPRSFTDVKEEETLNIKKKSPTHRIVQSERSPFRHQYINGNIVINILKRKWIFRSITFLITLILLISILNYFHNAKVTVRPHFAWMEISDKLVLFHNPMRGELGFDIMVVSEEVTIPVIAEGTQDVFTTASGTLKVYNDYSTEPQRLLPETRFESVSGKIFKLGNEEVIVPGKTAEGPGEIEVIVYASQAGDDFNIASTDFSIPGFRELGLDEKYKSMYGVSLETFQGGSISQAPLLTETQRNIYTEELRTLIRKKLHERIDYEKTPIMHFISEGVVFYNDEPNLTFDATTGEGSFTQSGKALVFFVNKSLVTEYLHEQYVLPKHQEVELFAFDSLHFRVMNPGTIDFSLPETLAVEFESTFLIRSLVNESEMKRMLTGKEKKNLDLFFEQQTDIDRMHIQSFPWWQSKLPMDTEKIKFIQYW